MEKVMEDTIQPVSPIVQNSTTCEICSALIYPKNEDSTKRFPVKFMRFVSLCQTCYTSEKQAIEQAKPIMQQSVEAIVSKREEFFNAERTDIALLTGTPFERIIQIRERIDKWKNLLFEIKTREESAFTAVQELAQKISAEERNKLKISDLSYNSVAVSPKPKAQRVSAEDKSINSMVKALFGFKITKGEMMEDEAIVKVKEIIRNSKNITFGKLASGEIKCTCSSTPGICKVHEKVD